MPKEKIENWKKGLDEQWKETDHYIIWEFWIKGFIRRLLKSKQEKLLKRIKEEIGYCQKYGMSNGIKNGEQQFETAIKLADLKNVLETLKESIKKEV